MFEPNDYVHINGTEYSGIIIDYYPIISIAAVKLTTGFQFTFNKNKLSLVKNAIDIHKIKLHLAGNYE